MLKIVRMRNLTVRSGQALAVVAVALPMFFAMALIGSDGSKLFVHHRSLQSAADAAALAAARRAAHRRGARVRALLN